MKPTKEQLFWEQCGFTILSEGMCLYPEDKGVSGRVKLQPPIDLNNLFLYAIPKIKSKLGWDEALDLLQAWIEAVISYGRDPADSLFNLIYKVLVSDGTEA